MRPAVAVCYWKQQFRYLSRQWPLLFFGLTVHNTELHSLKTPQSAAQTENNGGGAHPKISALIYPGVMVKPESRFLQYEGWLPGVMKRRGTTVNYSIKGMNRQWGNSTVSCISLGLGKCCLCFCDGCTFRTFTQETATNVIVLTTHTHYIRLKVLHLRNFNPNLHLFLNLTNCSSLNLTEKEMVMGC